MNNSIGTGRLLEDGTITLKLRAVGEGVIGDAEMVYAPDNEHYQEVRAHLEFTHGILKVGEAFYVPPFPD